MADEVEVKDEPIAERDQVNDDVRSAIAALRGETVEAAPDTAAAEEPPETVETKPAVERARAPDGKFAPKTEAAPEQAAAAPELPPTEAAKPSVEQPSTAVGAAPVSWAADVKAQWASLPPAVQQAVIKRETEVSNGFRQYSEQTRQLERLVSPIAQEAKARGLSVEDGVQRLIDGQRFLEAQPAQAILWLAQRHGLDLAELASNPPAVQTQARPDPQFAQVSQTVQSLQERLDSILMDQNMSVVEQFAQKNPHYAEVENDLPDLMRALSVSKPELKGQALLQEAYDLAIWKNPTVRTKMVEQQQADVKRVATEQASQKAAQASKAAVSVRGSSSPSVAPKRAAEMNGTVHDDVRAAIQQLRAG